VTGAVAAQIARALAHTAPEVLLPQGRAGQNTQLTRPLSLLAAVEISPPTAMVPAAACLVADGTSGWIAAPLLLDGGRLRRAAPGDGASADLVRMLATRGPGPVPAGIELVTFEDRSGDVSEVTATLAALVDGRGAQIVGGVSLGAHAAVAVAATRPWLAGAWLVLPAWTGPPGPVAPDPGRARRRRAAHPCGTRGRRGRDARRRR